MGLQENIKREQVRQLEIRDAVCVAPTTPLREVISKMCDQNLGCAIIVDEDRKPAGMFTESNLTEVLAHGAYSLDDPIEQHMARRCPWVRDTDPVSDVLEAMQLKNMRLLCVVDGEDRVVGVTGQRGLMEYVAEHFPGQVMVQRIGLSPYLSDREGA